MIRGMLFALLGTALLTGAAGADTVYLSDGTTVEGAVTKTDDAVTVTTDDGKTRTIPADRVLYVAQPKPEPDTPAVQPPGAADRPAGQEARQAIVSGRMMLPESIVYALLRRKVAASADEKRLDQQIRAFRAKVHDRQRQIQGDWLRPEDFAKRHALYDTALREAGTVFENYKENDEEMETDERAANKKAFDTGCKKLLDAATDWPDPTLRQFLRAEAYYQAQQYHRAEPLFQMAARDIPFYPPFVQGVADCQLPRKRYTAALQGYLAVLDLLPDSRDAVSLLSNALAATPGAKLDSTMGQLVRERLNLYEEPDSRRTDRPDRTNRLRRERRVFLAEDELRGHALSLPDLDFDTIYVRQAWAVPIAEDTLLLDGRVLEDEPLAIAIAIGTDEYIGVGISGIGRAPRRRRDDTKQVVLPLRTLTVTTHSFTPVPMPETLTVDPESFFTAHGIDMLREMGNPGRSFPVRITSVSAGGALGISPAPAPGEPAGPVFDVEGRLVGFTCGDLDAMSDDRPNTLYDALTIQDFLGKRRTSRRPRPGRSTRKADADPVPVEGNAFRVYVVCADRFEK